MWMPWGHWNNVTSYLWMHALFTAALDLSRRKKYPILELKCSKSLIESRVWPTQYYLQRPSPFTSITHSRQTYKEYLPGPHSRDQNGIIYWQVDMLSSARQVTNPQRLKAHQDSTFWRLSSYFQCIGLGKFANAKDTTRRIYLHIQHKTAYSYITTLLPPHSTVYIDTTSTLTILI